MFQYVLHKSRFLRLLLAANPSLSDILLLAAGVFVAIAASIPLPISVSYYGTLLDELNGDCGESDPQAVYDSISRKVLSMVLLGFAYLITIYVYTGACGLFGERLVYRIRCKYVESILRQEMAHFDTLPPGEAAASLDSNMQSIQSGASEKIGLCIFSFSYVVVAFTVSFALDAKLTLMLAASIPVLAALSALNMSLSSNFAAAVERGLNTATGIATDCLNNLPVIHAFRAAGRFEAMFTGRLLDTRPAAVGKFITAATQLGILYLAIFTSNAVAVWQGSKQIADGAGNSAAPVQYGKVWVVMLLIFDSSGVLAGVTPLFGAFQDASLAFQRLEKLIERESSINGTREGREDPTIEVKGNITFSGVSFNYPSAPNTPVLKSLDLSIRASKMTALVGASGSGKSTVGSLICRLYDPTEGNIALDDRDITSCSPAFLRRNVAFVEQDPILLDMSIFENVASGVSSNNSLTTSELESLGAFLTAIRGGLSIDSAADQFPALAALTKQVIRALDRSGAWGFVQGLSHGVATKVGPKGCRMSGGQRQRIAIARALIRNAPIMVLDEATASLDSANENYIQTVLQREFAGKTIVFIAHRLSTIKSADHVVVLKQGEVVEQGAFEDLVAKKSHFARMVQLQAIDKSGSDGRETHLACQTNQVRSEGLGSEMMEESSTLSNCIPSNSEGGSRNVRATPLQTARAQPFNSSFHQILQLSRPQRLWIFLGIIAAFFIGQAHIFLSIVTGLCVKDVNICSPESVIRRSGERYGLAFLILAVSEFAANICSSSSFGWAAEQLVFRTRVQLFRAFLHQDVAWHESEGRTPKALLSHITADTASLSSITGNVLGVSLGVVIAVVSGIILAHIVAWRVALALLLLVPLLFITSWMRIRVLSKYQEKHKTAFASSVAVASEAVEAIRTIALFGLEGERLAAYKRALREPYDATLQTVAYGNLWLAIANSAQVFIFGAAYWWGSKMVLDGYNTQSEFFTAMLAMLFGAQAAGILLSMGADISRAQVAAGKVLELLPLAPSFTEKGTNVHLGVGDTVQSSHEPDEESALLGSSSQRDEADSPRGSTGGMSVSFHDVYFTYPSRPSVPVLRGMSLDIASGSLAAIVGPSGSGKTTIISLIERFYQHESGTIWIDGVESGCLTSEMQDAISLAPQSSSLFYGTAAFNISIGAGQSEREISPSKIEEAACAANIHDTLVGLPDGYNSQLGSDGSRLSGGQRHRVAIARALVRPSRLLLLDEPTAALDAESEDAWQHTLAKLRVNGSMTVVIVAHRLVTVRDADIIFYVEDGRCIARGTHEALFASCKAYRQMCNHQGL